MWTWYNDTANTVFASTGTSNLDIFGDLEGYRVRRLCLLCISSRENFLAKIHNMSDSLSSVEHINMERSVNELDVTGWTLDASIGSSDPFSPRGENPNYDVNSLVDIDGGTGVDRIFVNGTKEDDSYVVTAGKVFGGGLTINFANIKSLEVDCQEVNDLVSVLSTSPELLTTLYGNLGKPPGLSRHSGTRTGATIISRHRN